MALSETLDAASKAAGGAVQDNWLSRVFKESAELALTSTKDIVSHLSPFANTAAGIDTHDVVKDAKFAVSDPGRAAHATFQGSTDGAVDSFVTGFGLIPKKISLFPEDQKGGPAPVISTAPEGASAIQLAAQAATPAATASANALREVKQSILATAPAVRFVDKSSREELGEQIKDIKDGYARSIGVDKFVPRNEAESHFLGTTRGATEVILDAIVSGEGGATVKSLKSATSVESVGLLTKHFSEAAKAAEEAGGPRLLARLGAAAETAGKGTAAVKEALADIKKAPVASISEKIGKANKAGNDEKGKYDQSMPDGPRTPAGVTVASASSKQPQYASYAQTIAENNLVTKSEGAEMAQNARDRETAELQQASGSGGLTVASAQPGPNGPVQTLGSAPIVLDNSLSGANRTPNPLPSLGVSSSPRNNMGLSAG